MLFTFAEIHLSLLSFKVVCLIVTYDWFLQGKGKYFQKNDFYKISELLQSEDPVQTEGCDAAENALSNQTYKYLFEGQMKKRKGLQLK